MPHPPLPLPDGQTCCPGCGGGGGECDRAGGLYWEWVTPPACGCTVTGVNDPGDPAAFARNGAGGLLCVGPAGGWQWAFVCDGAGGPFDNGALLCGCLNGVGDLSLTFNTSFGGSCPGEPPAVCPPGCPEGSFEVVSVTYTVNPGDPFELVFDTCSTTFCACDPSCVRVRIWRA